MALQKKSFNDIITFTRSTTGGRFNALGVYEMIPANQPRFNYDPVTRQPLGILIEESRTNQIIFSSSMSGGSWVVSRVTRSEGAKGPDGLPSVKIVEEKDSVLPREITCTLPITTLTPQCVWALVKPTGEGSKRNLRMNLTSSGVVDGSSQTIFDLDRKVIVNQQAGIPAFMEELVDGWFQVGFVYTPIRAQTTAIFFTLLADVGGVNYPGDGISGLNICWPQLETGTFRTSYIPTQASQVTRTADLVKVNTLSPWYNPSGGTLYTEFNPGNIGIGDTCVSAWFRGSAAANSIITIRKDGSMDYITGLTTSPDGVVQTRMTVVGKPIPPGALAKAAFSFMPGDSALSVNGSAVLKGTIDLMPTPSTLYLGSTGNGQQFLNGHLRAIRYYPRRLTNAELQALTT